MQRRTSLKNLLIIAGGTLLLPSCVLEDTTASIPLDHLQLTAKGEELLAEIAETLIPKTDTPGAKELGIHQFVAVMVDDCYDKETQAQFMIGLKEIDMLSDQHFSKLFTALTSLQREELLYKIENNEIGENVLPFYNLTKRLTIQGYVKSEYVMSNLLVYQLVPGRYHGSFPVKDITRFEQHG